MEKNMRLIITIVGVCLGSVLPCSASDVWVYKGSLPKEELERDLQLYESHRFALNGYKRRAESEVAELQRKETLSIEEAAKLRRYDVYLAGLEKECVDVERSLENIRAAIEGPGRGDGIIRPIARRPAPIRIPND